MILSQLFPRVTIALARARDPFAVVVALRGLRALETRSRAVVVARGLRVRLKFGSFSLLLIVTRRPWPRRANHGTSRPSACAITTLQDRPARGIARIRHGARATPGWTRGRDDREATARRTRHEMRERPRRLA